MYRLGGSLHLTLHQLRLLLATAQEGSVSRAAERLHLTQPTLSAQLKQLAEQVGLPLHERVGRRLHLTEAGRLVAAAAARVAEELGQLENELAVLRGDQGGRLRLAVVSTAEAFIPRLLGEFRKVRPAVEVSLVVLNRQAVVGRLLENRDDLYIMTKPPAETPVSAVPFLTNPLVVVAAADHPLAKRKQVAAGVLVDAEFVLREPGSGTRLAAEEFFAARGVQLRPRLELGSNEAVRQAVAGGLGLSVLSAHALGPHPEELGIAVLPVRGTPIPARWQVVAPAGKRLTPLAQAFLDYLQERAPRLEAEAGQRLALAVAGAIPGR